MERDFERLKEIWREIQFNKRKSVRLKDFAQFVADFPFRAENPTNSKLEFRAGAGWRVSERRELIRHQTKIFLKKESTLSAIIFCYLLGF